MKQWTVYYRNANGTEESQVFEADGKPEVFAILKQKGISAVRIVEGTSAASRRNAAVAPSAKRGLVAGLAVVILAAGAYFLFFSGSGKPEKPSRGKASSAIKEVRPAAGPKTATPIDKGATNVAETVKRPVGNVHKARGSAGSGRVMTLMDGTVVTNKPRAIFKRDFETALMVALRPGGMTGGLFNVLRTKYTDSQILSMLKEMTIAKPDDDPDVKAIKKQVQSLKENILSELADGRSLNAVLNELQATGMRENKKWADALKMRAEAAKMGDPELVQEVIRIKNKELSEQGIRKIPEIKSAGPNDPNPATETMKGNEEK